MQATTLAFNLDFSKAWHQAHKIFSKDATAPYSSQFCSDTGIYCSHSHIHF